MIKGKFRGRSVYSGKWRYGDLLDMSNQNLPVITTNNGDSYKVDSVGRFAGIVDSNHIEIYEGDIIKYNDRSQFYTITFKDGEFYASYDGKDYSLSLLNDIIIVGNIYDNAELVYKAPRKIYINRENNIWSRSFSEEFDNEYIAISSIWHNSAEIPDPGKMVLYYYNDKNCELDLGIKYPSKFDILYQWMYLNDLIS